MTDVEKKDKKGKKQLVKTIELPIKAHVSGLSLNELKSYSEKEVCIIFNISYSW